MKFTQIPADTFKNLQMNAGILVKGFTPKTGEIEGLVGATTGGVSFNAQPSYLDFGDDIDNCPKNMLELKKLESWNVTMSGTFVSTTAESAKFLVGAADVDDEDETHIIPRNDIYTEDFEDLWWVGDYSDKNDGSTAGYLAIHMMNVLSSGGFKVKSSDKAKGTFDFEFTAHYSMAEQSKVPFEIFVKAGE